jgi:hypothetical protein
MHGGHVQAVAWQKRSTHPNGRALIQENDRVIFWCIERAGQLLIGGGEQISICLRACLTS